MLCFCSIASAADTASQLTAADAPVLAVPRMSAAPVIDGAINADEWKESLVISGVADQGNNILIPRPTSYYLGWDSGHLYLAARTYIRAGYKPRAGGRSPNMAGVGDDGLELVIKPMGKNLPVNNLQASFKFMLNSLGYTGDNTKLDLGQQLKSWMPKFVIVTRMTEPGSAPNGGRWLEIEMSSVPADFELVGDNTVGDEWRLMLGMNQFSTSWLQARIPCVGSYFEAGGAGYCRVRLVEKTPAVQMKMDSLSNLASDGTAALVISAFNPGAATELSIDLDIAGKIVRKETLKLDAKATAEWSLNEKLPADVKNGKMSLTVRQGPSPLLSYNVFFKVGYMAGILNPAPPTDPRKFLFNATFNPSRNWLQLIADSYYLPVPSAAKSVAYRVIPVGGDKPLAEGVLTDPAEWYFSTLLKLPEIQPGEYEVEAVMQMADGTSLDPARVRFTKKDEAKAFPEWWGKNYGNTERVLPPFTAMKQEGDAITCWGRSYRLNALGLPKEITSQNESVTAAPARLVVVKNGVESVIPLDTAATITDAKDWRVSFNGTSQGGGLKFSAAGWVEQDGLVYVDLTYGSDGSAPVEIDALRIEYPLDAKQAESLVCFGPGNNFSSKTALILPQGDAAKDGFVWSTLVTGRPGSEMTLGNFYPTVWIGSDKRGFMWWADNDKGWFPVEELPAHDVIRQGQTLLFRNNIISKTVTVDQPRTVSFSYNATPFKPLLKGWRECAGTEDGTFFQPHRAVRTDSKTGKKVLEGSGQQGWIHPESRYPEEWAALWAAQKDTNDLGWRSAKSTFENRWRDPYGARNGVFWGHMSFTLIGYGLRSIENELYRYFGGDWDANFDQSWLDYSMYLFDRAFREGGVNSTYWDITFPNLYGNVLSGHAYKLPDGRVQKGYAGWNYRRFFMRLQAVAIDNGNYPFCNGSHSTNDYVLVAMPWLDAVLDGERNWNVDISDQDWVDYYPIERMRSISSPHNWGVPLCWMGNIDTKDTAKHNAVKRGQGMWVWMHDSWRNPYIPELPRMPSAVLDWGVNEMSTEYIPYWRNPFVTSADPDILVSAWRQGDRIMLGIYNYNRKTAKDVSLKVDLDALNLVPKLPWQEFVNVRNLWVGDQMPKDGDPKKFELGTSATLDFNNRTLSLKKLPPHTLRLVGIRLY